MRSSDIPAIDKRMELFGVIPDDYMEWAGRNFLAKRNYIFFSRREKTAYCSACGREFGYPRKGVYEISGREYSFWEDPKHNHVTTCPFCEGKYIAKNLVFGRSKLRSADWGLLMQAKNGCVLVRYILHTRDFTGDYKKPVTETIEMQRDIHSATDVEYYVWRTFHGNTDNGKERWCDPAGYMSGFYGRPSEFREPRSITLYNKDFSFLKKTVMKYCCLPEYLDYVKKNQIQQTSPYIISNYLVSYHKDPCIEQLIKVGLMNIVQDLIDESYGEKPVLGYEKTVCKSLKITKDQLRILRAIDKADLKDVLLAQTFSKMGITTGIEEFEAFRLHNESMATAAALIEFAVKHSSFRRMARYLGKHPGIHKHSYLEHLETLEMLGYDISLNENLYPKDFSKRHEEVMKELAKIQEERAKAKEKASFEAVKKHMAEMAKKARGQNPLTMTAGELMIKFPADPQEIRREGELLHHCVATYIGRVIDGKTSIFFIRRTDHPDIPFYTLEWKDSRIVQCRGLRNCDMTDEVKAFTRVWAEKMRKFEKGRAV